MVEGGQGDDLVVVVVPVGVLVAMVVVGVVVGVVVVLVMSGM